MTEPGRCIASRYRLLHLLGKGAMGTVWCAEHITLGSRVAVKLIDLGLAKSAEAIARFEIEAKAAAKLSSAHVVQVFDYGVDDGTPYIAMELLDGESLGARLKREGRLNVQDMLRVLSHASFALEKAHKAGVVHRDIKPDNIFLANGEDGHFVAKILDFGVAKALGPGSSMSEAGLTRQGELIGSPYYMSPEQLMNTAGVDCRTDLWSIGVVAYQCVTGEYPFDGGSLAELFYRISATDAVKPSQHVPVPNGFDAWFAKACARKVDDRFQTAKEMLDVFRSIVEANDAIPSSRPATEQVVAAGVVSEAAPSRANNAVVESYTVPLPTLKVDRYPQGRVSPEETSADLNERTAAGNPAEIARIVSGFSVPGKTVPEGIPESTASIPMGDRTAAADPAELERIVTGRFLPRSSRAEVAVTLADQTAQGDQAEIVRRALSQASLADTSNKLGTTLTSVAEIGSGRGVAPVEKQSKSKAKVVVGGLGGLFAVGVAVVVAIVGFSGGAGEKSNASGTAGEASTGLEKPSETAKANAAASSDSAGVVPTAPDNAGDSSSAAAKDPTGTQDPSQPGNVNGKDVAAAPSPTPTPTQTQANKPSKSTAAGTSTRLPTWAPSVPTTVYPPVSQPKTQSTQTNTGSARNQPAGF